MLSLYALCAGFVLDLIVGDPIGWPHIVLGYGKLIAFSERALRRAFPKTKTGELLAGGALVIIMCAVGYLAGAGILRLAALLSPWLRFAVETILVWQCLSARSLKTASLKVHSALSRDITLARAAVGEIVGRDTDALDESGVVRATVETVAENTCDGVVAPLLFLAVGGAPLGMLYKAASTMDSMVGYKNERYLYFGRVAARLDDVLNFIPARLGGLFMIAAACLTGLDGKGGGAPARPAQPQEPELGAHGVRLRRRAGLPWRCKRLRRCPREKPTIMTVRPVERRHSGATGCS